MNTWKPIGTAVATTCGHPYEIQGATNDKGEYVTRHDAYPDPNATPFQWDTFELCYDCYIKAMDHQPHAARAWSFSSRSILNV